MIRGLVVVRPEPGNTATATRARTRGFDVFQLPLFAIAPVRWTLPKGHAHDALLVTSANAMRHGGPALAAVRHLPVVTVGSATAAAARAAGFVVAATGAGDAADAAALAAASGFATPLHLAGRERVAIPGVPSVAVYASDALAPASGAIAACSDRTIMLHSPRAARRVAELIGDARLRVGIAGLSAAIVAAAGPGWRAATTADAPSDAALLDAIAAAGD